MDATLGIMFRVGSSDAERFAVDSVPLAKRHYVGRAFAGSAHFVYSDVDSAGARAISQLEYEYVEARAASQEFHPFGHTEYDPAATRQKR